MSLESLEQQEPLEFLEFGGSCQLLVAEESSQCVPEIEFRLKFEIESIKNKYLWSSAQRLEKWNGSKRGHLKREKIYFETSWLVGYYFFKIVSENEEQFCNLPYLKISRNAY